MFDFVSLTPSVAYMYQYIRNNIIGSDIGLSQSHYLHQRWIIVIWTLGN